jgi:hypothetical protein
MMRPSRRFTLIVSSVNWTSNTRSSAGDTKNSFLQNWVRESVVEILRARSLVPLVKRGAFGMTA